VFDYLCPVVRVLSTVADAMQQLKLIAAGLEPIHAVLRRRGPVSHFGALVGGQSVLDHPLVLQPKQEIAVTLTFAPRATGHFSDTLELYVDNKPVAYATIVLAGWAVSPYLSFSEPSVRLPVVPLGMPSSQVIFLRALGYGDSPPTIHAALPALFNAAPVEVLFPEGTVAGPDALPVIISMASDVPVSFDVPISFYDDRGAKCGPAELCVVCDCVSAHRSSLSLCAAVRCRSPDFDAGLPSTWPRPQATRSCPSFLILHAIAAHITLPRTPS
jgi:hypothetical protein